MRCKLVYDHSSKNARWRRYPLDSLQIYFASSLELQEEFIKRGFYVPKSPDGKILMPLPIVYCNFRGWLVSLGPITIERLIPPQWLGLTPEQLNWEKVEVGGKTAYYLPEDEVYLSIGISGRAVILSLEILGYHLERTSIRGVNPDKWTNWVMLYIDAEYLDELSKLLEEHLPEEGRKAFAPASGKPTKEVLQGGKEVTYFVEVPVLDFSLCLGCFELVQRYLRVKAQEHCELYASLPFCGNLDEELRNLKLRLRYSPNVDTFAKVGVAKISGKKPQIMVKLASRGPKIAIRGAIKDVVIGKARGELVYCDHVGESRRQYLSLNLSHLYYALTTTKRYLDKLPKEGVT